MLLCLLSPAGLRSAQGLGHLVGGHVGERPVRQGWLHLCPGPGSMGTCLGDLVSALPQCLLTCPVPQTLFMVMLKGSPTGLPTHVAGGPLPQCRNCASSHFENLSA